MKLSGRVLRLFALPFLGLSFAGACAYDTTLRAYLDAHFWLPFSKHAWHFERKNVTRISAPFAGMVKGNDSTPLTKLRAAYQEISQPVPAALDATKVREALATTRADGSLTVREREEVDLIDAKIDMRSGQPAEPALLRIAQTKFERFLGAAQTPEFLSEARGWLAYIHFLLGEQTAAGKIYLDELNRDGSNLSRETLLNSLRMTYGYDGGPELLAHLEDYFDTAEHAAFAIQMVTNPHWNPYDKRPQIVNHEAEAYTQIKGLLESHQSLLESERGANALALLSMRTALRMGDPPAALKIAAMIPGDSAIREEPDFKWMSASAHFLSRDYAGAERPLLELFESSSLADTQKAAAAYGLCGVYQKTRNTLEQLRFALWLRIGNRNSGTGNYPSDLSDQSIYWASSGWDLNLLLDAEAPISALESFLAKYPNVPDVRVVRYSLAVRLARENRYEEAAQIYESIHANVRAPRMRQLAGLYREATRTDLAAPELHEAKYEFAEYLAANPERIYFNDALWYGLQRAALSSSTDSALTGEERRTLMAGERKLKDDQEERWRAYLILRDVVGDEGKTDLGRKAARLAIQCLRRISERFERHDEIRKADIELSTWLRP